MFLKFWIVWAFVGLSFATWLFWWSLKARQFEDSRRAAFLALDDPENRPVDPKPADRHARFSLYVLLGIAGLGVGMLFLTIVLAVIL